GPDRLRARRPSRLRQAGAAREPHHDAGRDPGARGRGPARRVQVARLPGRDHRLHREARAALRPGGPEREGRLGGGPALSREVQRVAVVGAGTMGHGIAQVAATAGLSVTMVDVTEDALRTALARIRSNLDEGVRRGKVSETMREAALANLATDTSLENAVRTVDLVIEAVPERLELKEQVFAELGRHAPTSALPATTTSSLSITEIPAGLRGPGRVLGLHFFNPVHIDALVEVVRGERTDPAVVDAGVAFARRLGKEPIVVKDSPGFASSRLGVLLGLEAMRMLEEGVATRSEERRVGKE